MDPISGNSKATEQTLSPTEDLRKRFHSVVTLTQLVSAINKGGYPTLRTFSRKIHHRGGPLYDMLHVVVNILVRNTELRHVSDGLHCQARSRVDQQVPKYDADA
ncbi:hypothetical protein PILCRDRAFT_826991 [Piloderma croceum F 1598]|uniref:Uncharacterized protein n=1 Tax=Piloderma croceum (strain F 1598) TaxID=765440 RepID=A0A0C3F795_PILCF|nr:hypothetical protein PILCRDRAFT_826991 [Piloderma croceum F 1598]